MDFDDLVRELAPPPNRVGKCVGGPEHHLDEGAVMVAFAMHLLRTTSTQEVRIHPAGVRRRDLLVSTLSAGKLHLASLPI